MPLTLEVPTRLSIGVSSAPIKIIFSYTEGFSPSLFIAGAWNPVVVIAIFAPFMQFNGNLSLRAVPNLPNFGKVWIFFYFFYKRE